MKFVRATFALLALAALGCGTGTDGKPVAPPTTPEPAPAPPRTARAGLEVWSEPSTPDGYTVGERIVLVVRFEDPTTVVGSPRLAVEIGEHVRLADFAWWIEDDFPPERPSWLQRFVYEVAADDRDADGISVPADALDFTDGALLGVGVEIEVEITRVYPEGSSGNPVAPGKPLDAHRVLGEPELMACTDQRKRALNYTYGHTQAVHGWQPDRPIRFRVIEEPIIAGGLRIGRPNFLEEEIYGPLRDMARRLEERLGYKIMDLDAPPGGDDYTVIVEWRDRVWSPGWGEPDCPTYVGSPWNAQGSPPGTILNRYLFDPTITCAAYPRDRDSETIIHELAHTFGMNHSLLWQPELPPENLSMSVPLTRIIGGDSDNFLMIEDLDNLGCVFPHPDFPR